MSLRDATAVAQIGFGEVRHTRHRPKRHAFAYPTYFLMLPMRSLRAHGNGALARNRRAALAFHDRDHGVGGPDCLAWIDGLLAATRHHRRPGRGVAAHLPAGAGLQLQAGELLVLPPQRRLAARGGGRGEQHLWRAPLLPARCPAIRRAVHRRQGVPCVAVLPGARAVPLCVHAHRAADQTPRAPWRASTTPTPPANPC